MQTSYSANSLSSLVSWCALLALLPLSGCQEAGAIRRYQVPHEAAAPLASAPSSQRTLGAIIPRERQVWFFKAMGSKERIGDLSDDFFELIRSVTFDDGRPKWQRPAGWTEAAGNQFRYATLNAGDTEVTVSALPIPASEDLDRYVLANVNRWRDELAQPPVRSEQLSSLTERVPLSDGTAIVFDSSKDEVAAPRSDPSGLTYDVPEGWERLGPRPMRLATFAVQRVDQRFEVWLSRLGVNSGSLLNNVNRWRGQLQLGEIDASQLENVRKQIVVDGEDCDYIQLFGPESEDPQQAVFVVVVKRPDHTLFIKLMGDRKLAEDERENFETFVRSIRFSSS